MIFTHFGDIMLWAAQIAIVVIVGAALFYPVYHQRRKRLPPPQGYDYSYSNTTEPVKGQVAVRIVRSGSSLTIGTVATSATDFEERLNSLVSAAEDRANSLNAAEEILR